jgi:hypothetical protein
MSVSYHEQVEKLADAILDQWFRDGITKRRLTTTSMGYDQDTVRHAVSAAKGVLDHVAATV